MIGPLLIFLLAVYLYFLAGGIDVNPMPGQLGAGLLAQELCSSCSWSAAESRLCEIYRAPSEGGEARRRPPSGVDTRKLVLMIVAVLAVVFLMDIIGFILANFLFLLLFMRIAGLPPNEALHS